MNPMKSLIQKISFRWDIMRDRFQYLLATQQSDIDACIEVLEEVRKKELNRVAGQSVLDSHAFAGEALDYKLGACRDTKTGQIVGCMRITDAFQAKIVASTRHEYHLDLFPDHLLRKLKIFTRLAVLRPYRKSPAALVLMVNGFKNVLENGGQAVLMSCEPNLFTMYKRLGLRPIGPPHNSPSGGYRIPMIFMPDLEYMKKIKSPVLPWAKKVNFTKYGPITEWYQQLEKKQGALLSEDSLYQYKDQDVHDDQVITKGLSSQGRQDFLKNAMVIKCNLNDLIIAENDGGKAFGIVKKGKVRVMIEDQTLAVLNEGDIFGEIAFVLNANRTATLMAASADTEVLLFSISSVKRLAKEEDKTIIWQNMAKILARRLVQRTSSNGG